MSTLIYIETTIPSFHTETRTSFDVAARRGWTRDWWSLPKPETRLVTSAIVFEELERIPDAARRAQSLALIRGLEQLDYTREVAEIAAVYLHHRLMPTEALGDADHLALASFYVCDMLVTWNCRHLANANKTGHIRRVNALLDCARRCWSHRSNSWSKTMKLKPDKTLEEIWAIRRQIAKKFTGDPLKQVAHYQRKQKQLGAKIYRRRLELAPTE